MKHIIFLLLLGVYSLAFAQKKIIGNWYLFDLFGEKPSMDAAQVLKLAHYKVCLQFFVGESIGSVGLVKDLDTGTYYYVVQDTSAQKESEFFHFTSEELKSEKSPQPPKGERVTSVIGLVTSR